jgi:hypothetical protein
MLMRIFDFLNYFFVFLLSYVWNSVKILVCLPAGKRKPPAGEGFCGEPPVLSIVEGQVASHSVART